MIINIVGGSGAMGRTHAPELEKQGHKVLISGRTSNPSPVEAAKMADLTIVSVPIRCTEQTIREIAPYSKAILDFTSVKVFPLIWMNQYAQDGCEIGGLHPLYAEETSIAGKTIVYCPIPRSGSRCEEIVKCFENQGASIERMSAAQHDILMAAAQTLRVTLFSAFGLSLKGLGMGYELIAKCSPAPTKTLLNLLARQSDAKNDEMYEDMRRFNPYQEEMDGFFINNFGRAINRADTPSNLREFFGEYLESAQKAAKGQIKKL